MKTSISINIDYGSLPLDENGFVDWILDAEPGAATPYYRGHLAYDRCESTKVHPDHKRRRLIAIARRALAEEENGLVHLVQRRLAEEDYIYLMVRASLRMKRRAR